MNGSARIGFALTIRLGFGNSRQTLIIMRGQAVPKYDYEVERAAQVLAYFALRAKNRALNILKAMKLVYLADRESIRRFGEPMLDEPRFSMKRGPVNHMTYQLASGQEDQPAEWSRYLHARDQSHDIAVRGNITFSSLGELSEDDVECLDAVWRQFGWMDEHVLCAWTHKPENVPEWTNPNGGRKPISLADMLAAVGVPDARQRAEDLEHRGSLKQLVEAVR